MIRSTTPWPTPTVTLRRLVADRCPMLRSMLRRLLPGSVVMVIAMVAVAELLQQRAGRAVPPPRRGSTAVIVLGYPTRADGRPHPIQRWRVDLGVRVMRSTDAKRIVFSGGSPANTHREAETMAGLARVAGVPDDAISTECQSNSTWQNVVYSAPLVEQYDEVILVSDPLHAKRAWRYWMEQHPQDRGRVFVTDERRLFESMISAVPTAMVELVRSTRDRVGPLRRR